MAARIVKKIFQKGHSTVSDDAADGTKEEEEGVARSARFADVDPTASPGKKKGKKEVRVQEPASEDGEQQKVKTTNVKKSAEKKGPPSVSSRQVKCK